MKQLDNSFKFGQIIYLMEEASGLSHSIVCKETSRKTRNSNGNGMEVHFEINAFLAKSINVLGYSEPSLQSSC